MNALRAVVTLLVGLGMVSLVGVVQAEMTVVSPSASADQEGDNAVPGGPGPVRFQFLYPYSDFMSLPASHRTITGLAFRPDQDNTFTDPVSGPARFLLSTIDSDELDLTFANNIGDDALVVFDDTITWQTDDLGPGPRDFDFVVPFDEPFSYDPSPGKNLLVEFIASGNWDNVRNWYIDSFTTNTGMPTEIVGIPPSTVAASEFHRLWPAQFTFVPEPSCLVLAAIGLLGLAAYGWRGGIC